MPLQIVGVGFGRTGTDSTREALNQLGFPCYHMREVLSRKNKGHLDFWNEVAFAPPGTQHNWDRVFHNYTATIDNPAACVWKELLEKNPEAKVLLTLHPGGPDAWYDSTWETIHAPQRMWQWKVLGVVVPFARKMASMTGRLIWDRFYHNTMGDRAAALARYAAHTAEVQSLVPADRLLIFQVKEGWEPLCEFLGVPVPDVPFPRINERAAMKKQLMGVARVAYGILALGFVALLGLIYGLWTLLT